MKLSLAGGADKSELSAQIALEVCVADPLEAHAPTEIGIRMLAGAGAGRFAGLKKRIIRAAKARPIQEMLLEGRL